MKLIAFTNNFSVETNAMKWTFVMDYKGKTQSFILKEKADWPMIFGMPLPAVEKWLMERYSSLCFLAFGELR